MQLDGPAARSSETQAGAAVSAPRGAQRRRTAGGKGRSSPWSLGPARPGR